MPDDFCPEGNCSDADVVPGPGPYGLDFELTDDQIAHLEAGGALDVKDTRRSLLKKAGKLGGVLGMVGLLGKLTVAKVDAADCNTVYCAWGRQIIIREVRTSSSCAQGVSCWNYIKCWYSSGNYYYTWCRAYCGAC